MNYDPDTGLFYRDGKRVGTDNGNGYLRVWFQGRRWYAHRLAFQMMGEEVPEFVDHINGDRSDNRWCNLRPATKSQNNHARNGRPKGDRSLPVGVYFDTEQEKYYAKISVNRRQIRCRRRESCSMAVGDYVAMSRYYFGEYANV